MSMEEAAEGLQEDGDSGALQVGRWAANQAKNMPPSLHSDQI